MSVSVRPVPALGDFLEVLAQFGRSDLANLQDDIQAYEVGKPPSPELEEVLRRAECLAVANHIMERIG